MKTLLAAIAILLSANLAAQDDQFKIKGFYAGMPLEEFQAIAESHGALRKLDAPWLGINEPKGNLFLFKECEKSLFPDDPSFSWICERYSDESSNLTVAAFEVYRSEWQPYEAPKFDGRVEFRLISVAKDTLFKRLTKRFGEPSDNKWEESDKASWTLGEVGEFEYGLLAAYYSTDGEGRDGEVNLTLYKQNPSAAYRALQAKELEAENDF